jgi:hypothetical protein
VLIILTLLLVCLHCPVTAHASPEIYINIPEYVLFIIDNGKTVKKYDIAVGTPYEQTPTGKFVIFAKEENPTWYPGSKFTDRTPVPPGPDNPLGSRWLEFSPSYGIHGTNKGWDISYPVSGGCIRMNDIDAQEVYTIVDIGTPVTIVYETLRVVEKPDGLYLKVLPDIYGRKVSTEETFQNLYAPFAAAGYKIIRQILFPLKDREEEYEIKFAVGRKMNSVSYIPKKVQSN